MTDITDVRDRVVEVIEEQLGVDKLAVTPDAKIIDDLGADSLDVVELALALEGQFEIEISDDQLEKLVTVGEIVEFIVNQKGT